MAKITPQQAEQMLSDISPKKVFVLKKGGTIKSIGQLLEALKNMDDETFNFHVNNQKNDFSNWIRDVIQDADLAKSILKHNKKKDVQEIVDKRIKRLKWIELNPLEDNALITRSLIRGPLLISSKYMHLRLYLSFLIIVA